MPLQTGALKILDDAPVLHVELRNRKAENFQASGEPEELQKSKAHAVAGLIEVDAVGIVGRGDVPRGQGWPALPQVVTEQAWQHLVGVWVFRMPLEAHVLEILDQEVAAGVKKMLGDREAEDRFAPVSLKEC